MVMVQQGENEDFAIFERFSIIQYCVRHRCGPGGVKSPARSAAGRDSSGRMPRRNGCLRTARGGVFFGHANDH